MSLFDSVVSEAKEKFNITDDKATGLLSTLLAVILDKENGGFSGFLARFKDVGLEDTANSWINTGANTPLSNEQTESVFGEGTLKDISDEAGLDYETTTSATAFMVPHIVDNLTPDGEVPDETSLLETVGGYLTGIGGAVAGAVGSAKASIGETADDIGDSVRGAFAGTDEKDRVVADSIDNVGDAPEAVAVKEGSAFEVSPGTVTEDGDSDSILKWLIPLILLALLAFILYMSCGPAPKTQIANTNTNTATNKTSETNSTTATEAVDSSFTLKAEDGKYVVSGVVKDEATKKQITDALIAQYGEGNVDFTGLKVDANAKPFGEGWWANFQKLLPSLKDWKTGTLSFAGNAITAASGLPQAAMDQLKSLFSGWTMPTVGTDTATDTNRTLTEVSLPDGTKLQAYPGGIEDQLIKFIQSDDYKNGTAESLKDKWFNFDDLNFKFGSTELVPESKRQLDNIVAILKAYPDVKIKIGGYTDKKGDDAANKKLSDERAKAVKTALEKEGVGTQVPEAEGYGEEFATVAETASDEERQADRKTAVRLLK